MGKILGALRATGRALMRCVPDAVHVERFEMQRMAPDQRRHLWLSFICCVALLG